MSETSRLIIGPFNRVEGDLEVRLEMAGDRVEAARVTSPLYRGFEGMLTGRAAEDALVYAPRICGICSVSQSVAAARALAGVRAAGTARRMAPPNGRTPQSGSCGGKSGRSPDAFLSVLHARFRPRDLCDRTMARGGGRAL
jgi:hypothetical protein